ncbi:unnamed protein product [Phytophthora fragariaefolia]|uniref:Unnamed protein product n=1 Tax=Phytophthora fragariaefolia TaxID=1490495 RepID=A0A9W6Y5E1_9STRA|nr:unnamed protein product [Phytophthora fragariaefolia]
MADTREEGHHIPDGPTEVLTIPGMSRETIGQCGNPDQRDSCVMGSVDEGINTEGSGVSTRPSTAGTGDEHLGPLSYVPSASTSPDVGSQRGPTEDGRVRATRLDKYNEWRALTYSRSRDSDLYKTEGEMYKRWLAAQPSAVERVPYTTPTKILRRRSESSEGSVSDRDVQAECASATTEASPEMVAEMVHQEEARPKLTAHSDRASEGSEVAQLKLEGAYLAAVTVSEDWGDRDDPNASEYPGNAIEFEDYARELAFLPDLTEAASTTLDYTGPHVRYPSLSVEQQDRVVKEKGRADAKEAEDKARLTEPAAQDDQVSTEAAVEEDLRSESMAQRIPEKQAQATESAKASEGGADVGEPPPADRVSDSPQPEQEVETAKDVPVKVKAEVIEIEEWDAEERSALEDAEVSSRSPQSSSNQAPSLSQSQAPELEVLPRGDASNPVPAPQT